MIKACALCNDTKWVFVENEERAGVEACKCVSGTKPSSGVPLQLVTEPVTLSRNLADTLSEWCEATETLEFPNLWITGARARNVLARTIDRAQRHWRWLPANTIWDRLGRGYESAGGFVMRGPLAIDDLSLHRIIPWRVDQLRSFLTMTSYGARLAISCPSFPRSQLWAECAVQPKTEEWLEVRT